MSRPSFDEIAVRQELPELSRVVTAEDVRAYADASGDQNPLHQDDAFARSVGFDGVIAHGMFTMGHMARCVVTWAGGDPAAVSSISASFRTPVLIGDVIVAGGTVGSLDPASRSVVVDTWVSVERNGRTEHPIKRGRATVRLG